MSSDDAGEDGLPCDAFWIVRADSNESESEAIRIAERLVNECERFAHLRLGEAIFVHLFRGASKKKAGRTILGSIHVPRFQGELASLAYWLLDAVWAGPEPDFLLILDWQFWREATPLQREALVFHELCHTAHAKDREGELRFDSDGRPVFELVGHDIEEFRDVVARYGAWVADIGLFADALVEGKVLDGRPAAR